MDIAKARHLAQQALDQYHADGGQPLVFVDEAIVPWADTAGWCFPLHPADKLAEREWTLAAEAPALIMVNEDDLLWLG